MTTRDTQVLNIGEEDLMNIGSVLVVENPEHLKRCIDVGQAESRTGRKIQEGDLYITCVEGPDYTPVLLPLDVSHGRITVLTADMLYTNGYSGILGKISGVDIAYNMSPELASSFIHNITNRNGSLNDGLIFEQRGLEIRRDLAGDADLSTLFDFQDAMRQNIEIVEVNAFIKAAQIADQHFDFDAGVTAFTQTVIDVTPAAFKA